MTETKKARTIPAQYVCDWCGKDIDLDGKDLTGHRYSGVSDPIYLRTWVQGVVGYRSDYGHVPMSTVKHFHVWCSESALVALDLVCDGKHAKTIEGGAGEVKRQLWLKGRRTKDGSMTAEADEIKRHQIVAEACEAAGVKPPHKTRKVLGHD